jgi:Flp pilus assembly protein TadG
MIRLFQKSRTARRGNALLETAIVLPVLLSLAFGTVEFGYYFFVKNTVQGAAREGARAAIISTSAYTDVTGAVTSSLTAAGINTSTTTVQRTSSGVTTTITSANYSTITSGDSVTVTVSVLWSNVGFSPLGIIASNKQVTGTAVMRRE